LIYFLVAVVVVVVVVVVCLVIEGRYDMMWAITALVINGFIFLIINIAISMKEFL